MGREGKGVLEESGGRRHGGGVRVEGLLEGAGGGNVWWRDGVEGGDGRGDAWCMER